MTIPYSTGGAWGSHKWCISAYFSMPLLSERDEELDCITNPGGTESYYSSGWVAGGALN